MSDLTNIFRLNSPETLIDQCYEAEYTPRSRLGLSEIGHKCKRYLWYKYHSIASDKVPDGRVLRLFKLGNIIEDAVIDDLKAAGFNVFGSQEEIEFNSGGVNLIGHIDGKITGLKQSSKTHLLEIKTSNDKRFKQLLKLRSYEKWDEKYKAQIHSYMLGSGLERCLVAVYNKNNSDLYTERIPLNKGYISILLEKVFKAISQEDLPGRSCPKIDWYEAKWCDYYERCFDL